jgi:hypothetical protein
MSSENETKEITLESLELQNKALSTERDLAVARAEKAETELADALDRLVDMEVESLVGTKITPAEKPLFVRARKLDKSLFDEMLAGRKDMGLTRSVLSAAPIEAPTNFGPVEIDAFDIAAKAK